jgi:ankyrin repeat protein
LAVRENPHLEVVQLLLASEASAASVKNHNESLPLHEAIEIVKPEATEVLFTLLSAYSRAASAPNAKGWLPLHLAVHRMKPCFRLINMLLDIFPEGT